MAAGLAYLQPRLYPGCDMNSAAEAAVCGYKCYMPLPLAFTAQFAGSIALFRIFFCFFFHCFCIAPTLVANTDYRGLI